MAGVKGMKRQRAAIRKLADFRPLLDKWIGNLRLMRVDPAPGGEIGMTVCHVLCAQRHRFVTRWYRLREAARRPKCVECRAAKAKRRGEQPIVPQNATLKAIAELEPERRRLFYALVKSRRSIGEQEDITAMDMISACLLYAQQTVKPLEDLENLAKPIENTREAHSYTGWAMKHYGEHPSRY